jgi:tetratricopeptide (TPR) repeat protein
MEALANLRARQGKWKEGADIVSDLIQRAPTNHLYYHSLAPLLAASGDLEKYRRCCKEIVARFGDTTEPFVGYRMAKGCAILPSSGADLEAVGKMADVAAAAGPTNRFFAYFQCTKGMAEYRQGHFADALTFEDKTIAIRENPGNYSWHETLYVEAYAVSAMAHFHLDQTDAARAALAEANRLAARLPKLGSEDLGTEWGDWIIAHRLLDEATELIEGKGKTEPETK